MPTGKPDFNLNSYGVKYLSKEEVQEFLEKRQGESISSIDEKNSKIESGSTTPSSNIINTSRRGIGSKQVMNPHGQTVPKKMQGKGRNLTGTSQLKETTPRKFEPSEAGKKQIDATINTPKQPEPKGVDTKDTQFHYNESKPVSGEGMVREGASARGNLQTPTYSGGGRTSARIAGSGTPPKAATTSPNKGKKVAGQESKVSTGKMVNGKNTARAVFEETQGTGQESKVKIGEMGAGKKGLNEMIAGKSDNSTTRKYNKRKFSTSYIIGCVYLCKN